MENTNRNSREATNGVQCEICRQIPVLFVNNQTLCNGRFTIRYSTAESCQSLTATCSADFSSSNVVIMNSNKQLLAAGVGTAVIGFVCNNNAMWQSSDGAEQTGLACAAQIPDPCAQTMWNEWSNWSRCSKFCGSCGRMSRSRTCRNESIKCSCVGQGTETKVCNKQPCLHPSQMCCSGYVLGAEAGVFACVEVNK
ncbi:unnamed protein product [Dracunculus medinensis]|uniref:C6 domain-containing protein n=1 Tax=Dracunculus medinensis TaxID=318479 RepID=A0A0N4U4F1_DRAME|nr:unnamed protein product [Dracunculus medinensis]